MKMEVQLNVLTLNCWGVVGYSKHRSQRMAAIASYLGTSEYDFVFLQEIWSQDDYRLIRNKTENNYPYAHYFYSGVIGSGVCILSRSPIIDTLLHKYTVNGYAHKFYHGDWFGGKVVGMCKVLHRGLIVNLYVTHLHAEYNRKHDIYLPHRVSQAFEFSQFIRHTCETADLSIVAGDFNTEPDDLPYNIIVHNTGIVDSFFTQQEAVETLGVGATCGHPQNQYSTAQEIRECPNGKRIDFVMYKTGKGTTIKCNFCTTPHLKTHDGLPFSDHEAVVVKMHASKSSEAIEGNKNEKVEQRIEALENGQELLLKTLDSLRLNRLFYFLMGCLIVCLLVASVPFQLPYGFNWLLIVCRVILALALGFSALMGFLWNSIERSSLLSARTAMIIILDALTGEEGRVKEKGNNPYGDFRV